MNNFIAINWSSTHLKAYLINGTTEEVCDEIITVQGVSKINRNDIPSIVDGIIQKWPQYTNIYFCGMIGSTMGWEHIPYMACPVSTNQIISKIPEINIGEHKCYISPGLSCSSIFNMPDVMRGEEMQLFGYLYLENKKSIKESIICIPGKHSKWIHFNNGIVESFSTVMTGDIFNGLSISGLLKSHLSGEVEYNDEFKKGIEYGKSDSCLSRQLFSVRSRVVTNDLVNEDAASFAYGILIGSEINEMINKHNIKKNNLDVIFIGETLICNLYTYAISEFSINTKTINSTVAELNGFKFLNLKNS